ncbi:D-arabinose 1-dehydrogenase-like Zn-dependent alcohol dehydrogenase [Pseudoglutamicibacter cumminsii]|nr:D-arabinose 1-dehydrogenase-like Zn-dependent alcohol dehydrogenase [Pseudoglutamicibacter cumminsii]
MPQIPGAERVGVVGEVGKGVSIRTASMLWSL